MRVLWITNVLFPEAAAVLRGSKEYKSSGGWLLGASSALVNQGEIDLSVATTSKCVRKIEIIQGNRITYYVFPFGKGNEKYNGDYERYLKEINSMVNPDIVHIHGTEYSQGLAYVNACGNENVIVSIQGLKSAYQYYYYGLSWLDVIKSITFRDLFRGTIFQRKRQFQKSSIYEQELLKRVNHVIGRTSWDKANIWAINPEVRYHFGNETLREEFYDGSMWDFAKCQKHSIFVSQASYPIKGFHQLLKAMPLVLHHYPDASIRVAGFDLTRKNDRFGFLKITGYGKIISRLIKKNHLAGKIVFTGDLDASQMKQEYLNCNVFVCPSTIENSPNSLGEAQLLGVPCIAAYVGGIPDMMIGDEINMYRFEEITMLAKRICELFRNPNGGNMVDVAKNRHDPSLNATQLINIYKEVNTIK